MSNAAGGFINWYAIDSATGALALYVEQIYLGMQQNGIAISPEDTYAFSASPAGYLNYYVIGASSVATSTGKALP